MVEICLLNGSHTKISLPVTHWNWLVVHSLFQSTSHKICSTPVIRSSCTCPGNSDCSAHVLGSVLRPQLMFLHSHHNYWHRSTLICHIAIVKVIDSGIKTLFSVTSACFPSLTNTFFWSSWACFYSHRRYVNNDGGSSRVKSPVCFWTHIACNNAMLIMGLRTNQLSKDTLPPPHVLLLTIPSMPFRFKARLRYQEISFHQMPGKTRRR